MSLSRDSVLFPSEEYIQECIKNADRLRGERKPREGDYHIYLPESYRNRDASGEPIHYVAIANWSISRSLATCELRHLKNWIWLPRLDQLIEMLEERGYFLGLFGPWQVEDGKEYAATYYNRGDDVKTIYGPDPETALLRAYLEVVKSK